MGSNEKINRTAPVSNESLTIEAQTDKEKIEVIFADYVSDIVHVIERVMLEKKISRAKMAKMLGKSPSTISRQLDGEANLSAWTISEYLSALNDKPLASSVAYQHLVTAGLAQDVLGSAMDDHSAIGAERTPVRWYAKLQATPSTESQTTFNAWISNGRHFVKVLNHKDENSQSAKHDD